MNEVECFVVALLYVSLGIITTGIAFHIGKMNPLLKIPSIIIWPIVLVGLIILAISAAIFSYIKEIKTYYRKKRKVKEPENREWGYKKWQRK